MGEFWGLVAVALALAAIAATAIKLALDSRNDREARAKADARADSMLVQNGNLTRQLGAEAVGRVDDQHRYEGVIAGLKAEIARLEGLLDEDLDPTVVRGHLAGSGLLGGPEAGTVAVPGAAAAAALPPSVAAALGAVGRPAGGK